MVSPLTRDTRSRVPSGSVRTPTQYRVPLFSSHSVRQMDRRLTLEDAALNSGTARLRVPLDEVHLLDDDALLLFVHGQHAPFLPLLSPAMTTTVSPLRIFIAIRSPPARVK